MRAIFCLGVFATISATLAPLAFAGAAPGHIQIGDLQWAPGEANNDPRYFPSSLQDNQGVWTQTSHSLRSTANGKTVNFEFDARGGGYPWGAQLSGFSGLPEGFQLNVGGYGAGFLGAILDRYHRGRYNPEQAGKTLDLGAPTTVTPIYQGLLVPQFRAPLYQASNPGLWGDQNFTDYTAIYSDFDISVKSKDAAAKFGIPSVEHRGYWVFGNDPVALRQFTGKTLVDGHTPITDDNYLLQNISPRASTPIAPTETDLSYVTHTIQTIRPPTSFLYAHYRSGGHWVMKELKPHHGDTNQLMCQIYRSTYSYKIQNVGRDAPVPAGDCQLDVPFIALSNSPDPQAGVGMAIYASPNDYWNSQQTRVLNKNSLSTVRKEDRRIASYLIVSKWTEMPQSWVPKMQMSSDTTGWWFVTARDYLSGILSPKSASRAYGPGSVEGITERSYVLVGTPQEIFDGISRYEASLRAAKP